MKLLLSLIAYHCFIFVEVKGQEYPTIDRIFSSGIAELRALLNISNNIELVKTVISSNVRVPDLDSSRVSSNTVIRFELRGNALPVYDAGVTAEFFPNGSYAYLWTSRGEDIIVSDDGVPRVSSRQALYILARKFNLCPQMKYFQNKDFSLFYLLDPVTKVGRLIYRASVVHYGHVTSFGNETTETVLPTALIDANTGEVIQSWNGFTAQFATTRAILAFGGNVGKVLGKITYPELPVGLQADGQCIYSTSDVQVQSMNYKTNVQFTPTRFACNHTQDASYDNVNGGFSPLNDAMSNAQTTVNMYRAYVDGINQPHFNMPVKLRVHFGVNYANAFWDGTYAIFGDGSRTTSYPLVTLDYVAHELAHAFTSYRKGSNLEILGEPGGINEAFSDMSGQAAVFYSGRTPTMTHGAEATISGEPARDMCNPPSDRASIDDYKDYKRDMNPHYSSGLYNKAFCVLSRLRSWSVARAFQVFAFANRLYWRQKTTFNQGVCGVQKAASYLLGSNAVTDVADAFQQVGLSCVPR